jgi:hypothetical protein
MYAFLSNLGTPIALWVVATRNSNVNAPKEMIGMVRKETCPACKGNRWMTIKDGAGRDIHRKCPVCGGQGYKIRLQS